MVNIWDLSGTAIFLPSSDAVRTGHVWQPKHASDCIKPIKISYNDNLPLVLEFSFPMKMFLFKSYVLLSPADVKARTATVTLMSDHHGALPRTLCTRFTAVGWAGTYWHIGPWVLP